MGAVNGYRAFVSLCLEHGVYFKERVMRELGLSVGDYVWVTAGSGVGRGTIERIGEISAVKPKDEAFMLLSLLDCLANDHYYFLAEFGFTERVPWTPKQYDYVKEGIEPAFESLGEDKREHKTFKALYSIVEKKFLDLTMTLRSDYGVELNQILRDGSEEEKRTFMEIVEQAANTISLYISEGLENADLVIGAGTFFSTVVLPIETAFLISGVDVGSFALPDLKRGITVNPFLLYWLLTRIFRLDGNTLKACGVCVKIAQIEDLKEREVPLKELTLRVYSPSKICVETFYLSCESATQWVREKLADLMSHKPYILPGDVLMPFTCPSRVRKFELADYRREIAPFVNATPYGLIPYEEGISIPKCTHETNLEVEFFTNPMYDKSRPLVLDTNVVSILSFPYKVESPFFEAFVNSRKLIIPAVVVYELKRKLEVGKERAGVARALARLREINAMGLIDLEVSGELPPELILHEANVKSSDTGGEINRAKEAGRDLRDSLILLDVMKHKGVLFSNDRKLRQIALMFGVPSIAYNSLLDDVRDVVREMCKTEKVHKSHVKNEVKRRSQEIRGEMYEDEEVDMALEYLRLSGNIKFEGNDIRYVERT